MKNHYTNQDRKNYWKMLAGVGGVVFVAIVSMLLAFQVGIAITHLIKKAVGAP